MEKFFNAIRENQQDHVAKMLEANGKLLHQKDGRGSTPLLLATYYGHLAMADFLIEQGADINAIDASGNTALMGVCFKAIPPFANY